MPGTPFYKNKKLIPEVLQFLKRYWPTLTVVGVILYATLNDDPVSDMDLPAIPYLDKWIHAIMFGGLCGAWMFDLYRSGRELTLQLRLAVAGACLVAGVADEVLQRTVTEARTGEVLDWCADAVGIAVAFFTAPPAIMAVLSGRK